MLLHIFPDLIILEATLVFFSFYLVRYCPRVKPYVNKYFGNKVTITEGEEFEPVIEVHILFIPSFHITDLFKLSSPEHNGSWFPYSLVAVYHMKADVFTGLVILKCKVYLIVVFTKHLLVASHHG